MFFWFIGTAVLSVWFVFRDPAFDHRTLVIGALLPDVIDAMWGGSRGFHSVTASVAMLVAVMLEVAKPPGANRPPMLTFATGL